MLLHTTLRNILINILPMIAANVGNIVTQDVGDHRNVSTYRLRQKLLRYYHKEIRPVKNPRQATMVGMYCYLYQIFELDQKKNTIMLSGSFELFWQDDFMTWRPDEFDDLAEIHLLPTKVWIPELSIYYSPGSHKMLSSDNALKVNYTGGVRWFLPFTITALCPIDVKYFPFDEQECTLNFGPWAYTTDILDFDTLAVDQKDFFDNQEWMLVNTTFNSVIVNYTYLNNEFNFTFAVLKLRIHRQSFYYVFNLVAPTAIIAVVSVIGFHMPGSSGENRDAKFRLGIMTILSMTMLLLSIVNDMPKFSLQKTEGQRGSFSSVPLIGMYYFSLLGIIGVSTVTSSSFTAIERLVRQFNHVPWLVRVLSWSPTQEYSKMGYHEMHKMEPLVADANNGAACGEAQSPFLSRPKADSTVSVPFVPGRYQTFDKPPQVQIAPRHHLPPLRNSTPASPSSQAGSAGAQDSIALLLQAAIHDLTVCMRKLERTVMGIRRDARALAPKHAIDPRWLTLLDRLEWASLIFYLSLIALVLLMFFYHDWY